MKILCVLGGPISDNALETALNRFFKYVGKNEFDLAIFSHLDKRVNDYIHENKKNIEVFYLGKGFLNLILRIPRLIIISRNYDLIFTCGAHIPYGFIFHIISSILKKRFVCRVNGLLIRRKDFKARIKKIFEPYLIRSADIVSFNSKSQMHDILNAWDIEMKNNFYVIPPGIDFKYFYRANEDEVRSLRAEHGIDDAQSIIGVCMTPRPGKGLTVLIESALELKKKGIDFKIIIVGTSSHIQKYISLVKEKGLADKFYWAGHIPFYELYKWYSMFHVTVLSSWSESFGMSISESYMCGTPCAGSDVGGIKDQILHGVTGFLSEPGNAEDLAENILKITTNDSLRETFAKKGKEHVSNEFALDAVREKYKSLFDKISHEE